MQASKRRAALLLACAVALLSFAIPATSQAAGSGYFCNSDGSIHGYGPYQDCWAYTQRNLQAVYTYPMGHGICASWATSYGQPFTTSHLYNCGSAYGWVGIINNPGSIGWPENHMQSLAGNGLGYAVWN